MEYSMGKNKGVKETMRREGTREERLGCLDVRSLGSFPNDSLPLLKHEDQHGGSDGHYKASLPPETIFPPTMLLKLRFVDHGLKEIMKQNTKSFLNIA